MCTGTLIFENFQAVIGGSGSGEAFGGGPTQIWMDDVLCAGSESTLSACPFNGWGNHNCIQAENVGVCCQGCPPGSGCNGGVAAAGAAAASSRCSLFYTHTHAHTHKHTDTHTQTHVQIYIYICIYTCIHIYIYTYMHMSLGLQSVTKDLDLHMQHKVTKKKYVI
jgi:hypothetical protein